MIEHVPAEVLALEDVEVGQRDRRRDRVPGEGEAVREHRGAVHERLGDAVGDDHRAHRRIGRGHALGGRDDVRQVAVALGAEVVAEAPHEQITSSEISSTPWRSQISRTRWK